MTLTDDQKKLVQTSFVKVAMISEKAAELFYGRLFEIEPSVKPLFVKTDMRAQGQKLMQMIGTAVGGLDRLEDIVPHVEALGKRHVAYGVKKEHYDTVGTALLWTLEQGLGSDFTPDVKDAWAAVYGVLAKTAIDASYKEKLTQEELAAKLKDSKEINLTGHDLIGLNLSGMEMKGVQMVGANLVGANLAFADLSGASLLDAVLSGANLTNANLSGAKLGNTNLTGANLTAAKANNADLTDANLSGANLTAADFSDANLSETQLLGASLICTNLTCAKLTQADLTGALLTGANLTETDLMNANLRGANLTVAVLTGANLEGAKLTGVIGYERN